MLIKVKPTDDINNTRENSEDDVRRTTVESGGSNPILFSPSSIKTLSSRKIQDPKKNDLAPPVVDSPTADGACAAIFDSCIIL